MEELVGIGADPVPNPGQDSERQPRRRVSGIDRAVQILDYLQETGRAATGYDIARAVRAPVSTVYSVVDDLVDKQMLARGVDGTIWFGARLYHYGLAYARSLDLLTVATHEMHELCREVGETVQICGRDGDMMVVLAMAEGPGHFNVTSRVGTRVPLNWTASGRLLVSHLPAAERVEIFRRSARASPTGRAEIDPEALADAAAASLAARLSIQSGESDYAVACIASPIRDPDGQCAATVSIVLPEFKVQQDRERFVGAVLESARRIEASLGWGDVVGGRRTSGPL
ncbi:transcriptional regulator, IclR family [Faunimonas pinastri]|uniref:Transcriptional regulator, IclR family n=1 Tax=Faunimonas pinastri TaxID=1855383 RepID=A0A1H9LC22_9HYPH|nr:IclR family transcriptional regulator [Faunimonas pinastri]SER09061.1 transcriptional regulator, IclR family [Faunimonas pinastri]